MKIKKKKNKKKIHEKIPFTVGFIKIYLKPDLKKLHLFYIIQALDVFFK